MTELKPCPFCGSSEEWINYDCGRFGMHILGQMFWCRKCGGALIDPDINHCYNDIEKAWNRRAEE